jgi:hypothetical protein
MSELNTQIPLESEVNELSITDPGRHPKSMVRLPAEESVDTFRYTELAS